MGASACLFGTETRARADKSGETGLGKIASKNGVRYGVALSSGNLKKDLKFREAVVSEAKMIVPEGELKPLYTWPERGRFEFSGADYLVDFAQAERITARGHTLIWHVSNPPWLVRELQSKPSRALLRTYIETVVGRYRGRIKAWDVVNEIVDPVFGDIDHLVANPWLDAYGPQVVDDAFHLARTADPSAQLFYCDGQLELDIAWQARRRRAVLNLLERLVAKGVPIDGLAIQGHLKPFLIPFDPSKFLEFVKQVRSLGLAVIVSELDASDKGGDSDPVKRWAGVANAYATFVSTARQSGIDTFLTWGLSSKYTWLANSPNYKWADGRSPLALPLDENMRRTPVWDAMARTFSQAI